MEPIVNNPWVQGTALGALIAVGVWMIRYLAKEVSSWQDRYISISEKAVGQSVEMLTTLHDLVVKVDTLKTSLEKNMEIQTNTLATIEELAHGLDVKDMLTEAIAATRYGEQRQGEIRKRGVNDTQEFKIPAKIRKSSN